jgi:hypothetical protein
VDGVAQPVLRPSSQWLINTAKHGEAQLSNKHTFGRLPTAHTAAAQAFEACTIGRTIMVITADSMSAFEWTTKQQTWPNTAGDGMNHLPTHAAATIAATQYPCTPEMEYEVRSHGSARSQSWSTFPRKHV